MDFLDRPIYPFYMGLFKKTDEEKDGPMLEHGIKEMDKEKLWVPAAPGEKPDPARLELRFLEFTGQNY